MRLPKKNKFFHFINYFIIVSILFGLDLWTKYLVQKKFLLSSSASDIHDYTSKSLHLFTIGNVSNWFDMSLTYVRNTGAAWGLLGNMNERIRPYFFNVVTLVAIILIISFFLQTPKSKKLARIGMTFILAGAFGNFFDRFFFHYVIDWIHVKWNLLTWYYDFPVFNLADSCVTIGVSLLIIDMLISTQDKGKHNDTTTVSKKLHK